MLSRQVLTRDMWKHVVASYNDTHQVMMKTSRGWGLDTQVLRS